jgi:hypothetical protein
MARNLDPEEKGFLSETKRLSKKAFCNATRLLLNDTRWQLIRLSQNERFQERFSNDELRSSLVGYPIQMDQVAEGRWYGGCLHFHRPLAALSSVVLSALISLMIIS